MVGNCENVWDMGVYVRNGFGFSWNFCAFRSLDADPTEHATRATSLKNARQLAQFHKPFILEAFVRPFDFLQGNL